MENFDDLVEQKDDVQIERSFLLSRKDSVEPESNEHWSDGKRKKWTFLLFFGCLLVYATRTSVSISAVPIGKELGWDKQLSVSLFQRGFFTFSCNLD